MKSFDALWDYAKPDETELKFRALLAGMDDAADADERAQLLTQLARTLSLQQRFDEAHATLDRAADIIGPGDALPVARVRLLLERGRTLNSAGEPQRATPLFHEVWERAGAAGAETHAVDAAHMLEIVESGEAKLQWNAAACELAEHAQDPHARRWLGALYNNRGWTLHEMGRLDEALAMFELRLAWLRANPPDEAHRLDRHETEIGIAHWSVAKMFRLLGRTGEALAIQRALLETRAGREDGFVHEEIGECLLALGRPAEARPHFGEAHRLLNRDAWLRRNEAGRLARLQRLAAAAGDQASD